MRTLLAAHVTIIHNIGHDAAIIAAELTPCPALTVRPLHSQGALAGVGPPCEGVNTLSEHIKMLSKSRPLVNMVLDPAQTVPLGPGPPQLPQWGKLVAPEQDFRKGDRKESEGGLQQAQYVHSRTQADIEEGGAL